MHDGECLLSLTAYHDYAVECAKEMVQNLAIWRSKGAPPCLAIGGESMNDGHMKVPVKRGIVRILCQSFFVQIFVFDF